MRMTTKTLGFLGLPTFCAQQVLEKGGRFGGGVGGGVINNGVPTDVTMVVLDR